MMKLAAKIGTLLVCVLTAATFAFPQDQAKGSNTQPASHLRIDFLLMEYNGQQKINSLPYTISMEAGADRQPQQGKIRMGVKVPIATAEGQFQYMDIGTDIDCRTEALSDNSYRLGLIISRSSIYAEAPNDSQKEAGTLRAVGNHPVIQSFSTDFPLIMHDGETSEGTSATDPFNGHVLKISITLHVLK